MHVAMFYSIISACLSSDLYRQIEHKNDTKLELIKQLKLKRRSNGGFVCRLASDASRRKEWEENANGRF